MEPQCTEPLVHEAPSIRNPEFPRRPVFQPKVYAIFFKGIIIANVWKQGVHSLILEHKDFLLRNHTITVEPY